MLANTYKVSKFDPMIAEWQHHNDENDESVHLEL